MNKRLVWTLVCGLLTGCAHSITTPLEEINYAPLDANLPNGEVRYQTVKDLPDTNRLEFVEVLGWAQACAIDTGHCQVSAFVQMDWWKLWEVNPDSAKPLLVYQENYDATPLRGLNADEGGVYIRYPSWYATNEHYPMDSLSAIAGGYLYIYPAMAPKGICHWWTPHQRLKPNCGYLITARFLISGNLALQFGVDFWKKQSQWSGDGKNNERSWNSPWYGGEGFQEISFPIQLFRH